MLPIYDALYDSDIHNVLVRHEQGAAHMADGYARASGRTGVCMATSGPGATNLVTGLATAHMDSVPIVAITGQVPTFAIGRDSFQEADIFGITLPVTKHSYLVKDVNALPRIVHEAFYIARTGRPGPVLIDIPRDISQAPLDKFEIPENASLRGYRPPTKGHPLMIRKAARLLMSAERPTIYGGGGVIISGAHEELYELAHLINAPVTMTIMGKGGFPETDPLALLMPGMHGTAYANHALNEADVILAVGVRFDDRVTGKLDTFAPKARFIHIDVDPAEIGKSVRPEIPVAGDAKLVLQELMKHLKPKREEAWLRQIEEWKAKYPLRWKGDGLKPQFAIKTLYEATEGKAVVTTDVGQHQMWSAQYYLCERPRQFISSCGLGTMGYGFPAAIGAWLALQTTGGQARPDQQARQTAGGQVWCITSDGSFQMNMQEMATAVAQRVPVKLLIINNGYLGMVRQWQELFYQRRYSGVRLERGLPDFVKLAEAFGAAGLRVTREEELVPAIQKAMEVKDRPFLIDVWVEEEENVYPMVPAGGSIDQMMVD